jgi:hypothetical protein
MGEGSVRRRVSREHQHQLDASAISDAVAQARRYRSITRDDRARLVAHGFTPTQAGQGSGREIPIWDVHGENNRYQFRPDKPRLDHVSGRQIKYENLPKVGVTIDVHPLARDDVLNWRQSLWITEGVKKGDALVSAGVAAVALYSVWNWRGRDESGAIFRLPDWDEIPLKGRPRRV